MEIVEPYDNNTYDTPKAVEEFHDNMDLIREAMKTKDGISVILDQLIIPIDNMLRGNSAGQNRMDACRNIEAAGLYVVGAAIEVLQ